MAVFRDQSDLGSGSHLWGRIQTTLDASRYLIVLACPESAASIWVNKEIDHWYATNGTDRLILVVTAGDIAWDTDSCDFSNASTALPSALRGKFTEEPLYVDLRWARTSTDLSLRLSAFRSAVANIAAPIRGVTPAELESDDIREHRRTKRLARSAVAALVVLGITATAAAFIAADNRREADQRTRESVSRQVGLFALDQPISDVDTALLLSLAAARLDPEPSDASFQYGRALIGRYSRLDALLPVGDGQELRTIQAVGLSSNGDEVAAIERGADGSTHLLRWSTSGPRATGGTTPSSTQVPAQAIANGSTPRVHHAPTETLLEFGDAFTAVRRDGQFGVTHRVIATDDHRQRALMADDGRLTVVDLISEELTVTTNPVSASTIGHINDRLIALVDGRSVQLLDLAGDVIASGTLPTDAAAADAVASTTESVVVVTVDGDVIVMRREDSELRAGELTTLGTPVGDVRDLRVAPDGRRVLVIGSAGTVMVDVSRDAEGNAGGSGGAGGTSNVELDGDVRAAGPIAADPSGRFVAIGGERLTVWDLEALQRVLALPEQVSTIQWSGTCAQPTITCRLVSGGQSIAVWEPDTGRRMVLAADSNAQAVAISDDGLTVVSAGWGSHIARWSLDAAKVGDSTTIVEAGGPTDLDDSSGVVARASGTATTVGDRTVSTGPADVVEFAGSDRLIVVHDGTATLWNVADDVSIPVSSPCSGAMVAVTKSGALFAVHDPQRSTVALCDSATGQHLAATPIDAAFLPITALAVADDRTIAVGGRGHLIALTPDDSGGLPGVAIELVPGQPTTSVDAVATQGGYLAAGFRSPDAAARFASVVLWNPLADAPPISFTIDSTTVAAITFAGDVDVVVVASHDEADNPSLQAWEVTTRRRVGSPVRSDGGAIESLVSAGADIIAIQSDGSVQRWPLNRDPADEICAIVGRSLTRDEWSTVADGALRRFPYQELCPPQR
jgi:hypothetical protein